MSDERAPGASRFDPTEAERHALMNRLGPDDPEARVLWGFLARIGRIGETTIVTGDPQASAVNEGQRVMILRLADLVGMNPINLLKGR